ncbi:hypothetical protein M011DRAFT_471649 [Sporormia fimetaria CBS 119925]|uniref:F-box domain-containing protein n=1 Tax=Sporormia fimetaria CBS 119925 TaxID=1340428 RepID=A0A6A6UZD9_9PLEO|nr:hypothetical protein M011DRAFT_471649 [Sporormia fimetaria CBS 119925]
MAQPTEEELTEAQLQRFTSARPRIPDNILGDNLPRRLSSLPVASRNCGPARVDLGGLDVLPLELLQWILVRVDLLSLSIFRRVNLRAREVVDSIFEYQIITTHARDALRGSKAIGTSRWFSCKDLYDKLCTAECEGCGSFGGYLYLITCKRVCYGCFWEHSSYRPITHTEARRYYGCSRKVSRSLPSMRSLPGTYSEGARIHLTKMSLVDAEAAIQAGIALHGSSTAVSDYVERIEMERARRIDRRAIGKITMFLSCLFCWNRRSYCWYFNGIGDPVRFMAVVRTPTLDKATRKLEWGFFCKACQDEYGTQRFFRWVSDSKRIYTVDSFAAHLKERGKIEEKVTEGGVRLYHRPRPR